MKTIERIFEFIEYKGFTVVHFERVNSISNGYLSKVKQRQSGIGEEILIKILDNFPDISPDWLLTGKGSMLRESFCQEVSSREVAQTDAPPTNIKERVLYLIKHKDSDSYESFFDKIGMTYGNFKGNAKKTPLNSNAVKKILSLYSDVSSEWLLTGKGSMLRDVEKISPTLSDGGGVPLYDLSMPAGDGSLEDIIANEKIVGCYNVPNFSNVDWMIYVKGNSMSPKYLSGDIVACRVIRESKFIQWGKVYVIATKEQGILIKRLDTCTDDECFMALSDNPDYKPFQIPKSEVCGIAIVVGVIRVE